jgi:hypothetical protein
MEDGGWRMGEARYLKKRGGRYVRNESSKQNGEGESWILVPTIYQKALLFQSPIHHNHQTRKTPKPNQRV